MCVCLQWVSGCMRLTLEEGGGGIRKDVWLGGVFVYNCDCVNPGECICVTPLVRVCVCVSTVVECVH